MLDEASHRFSGNEWVTAVLQAMRSIADTRSRERLMKESMYSSGKLRSRLASKDEMIRFCVSAESLEPSYLQRKPAQGKGGPKGSPK